MGKRALQILDRMVRDRLSIMRQSADSPTALRGGGYLYSTHPDGRAVPPQVALLFLKAGIVLSCRDDLFGNVDGGGQVFLLSDPLPAVRRPKPRRRK